MDNETAVVSDHHSYDADGSEESEENQLQIDNQSISRSSNTIHGSTESLYYSAWALNDPQSESELNVKDDESIYEQTDSFFSSGLKDSAFNETGDGDAEEFQDCDQPPEMLYQHFNSRFSLPAGFGDRFAKIWGEKEAEEVEVSFAYLICLVFIVGMKYNHSMPEPLHILSGCDTKCCPDTYL